MSRAEYQRVQTRMILEPGYARTVAMGDLPEAESNLSSLERDRLVRQAAHPGLALTRTLHEGWRLTKLLTLLPTTFAADEGDELADLVIAFWAARPPRSLYFEAEATAFAQIVARTAASPLLRLAADHDLARLRAPTAQTEQADR